MADREIAGRCSCPICGAPAQDVRVNVNQKLYCYCDNGCSFKFNSTQSKQFLPQLRAGRNVMTSTGTAIFSLTGKESRENAENKANGTITRGSNETGRNTGGSITGTTDGRIDTGRRKLESAAPAAGRASGRGLLASWLIDDDDE